jgi:hypothetical protein
VERMGTDAVEAIDQLPERVSDLSETAASTLPPLNATSIRPAAALHSNRTLRSLRTDPPLVP